MDWQLGISAVILYCYKHNIFHWQLTQLALHKTHHCRIICIFQSQKPGMETNPPSVPGFISALHYFIPKLLLHFHLNSVILTSVSRGSFFAVRQFPPQSIHFRLFWCLLDPEELPLIKNKRESWCRKAGLAGLQIKPYFRTGGIGGRGFRSWILRGRPRPSKGNIRRSRSEPG